LVGLNRNGDITFSFKDAISRSPLTAIFDCYGLNVCAENEVWIYYYTPFSLVKIVECEIANFCRPTEWEKRITGAHSFSIWKEQALFRGGYHDQDSWFLLDLENQSSEEVSLLEEEPRPDQNLYSQGRGPFLYLWTNEWAAKYDIRDLL
jgi:hypothetical protein